jgi:UDP-glucose 4-epimerase
VRVLVTGATAPLGAALVRALLDDPAVEHVVAVGLDQTASVDRLTCVAVDLTHPRALHDLIHGPARTLGVEVVVHGALHRSARDGGARIHAANVESTRQLLLACENHPTVRRFVLRSATEVYAVTPDEPNLLDESSPLDLSPRAPQWVRDRVEADLLTCARMGMSRLEIVVLRCADVLAEGTGSQLHDYLSSRVCFRPLGFDPMINVLSMEDCVAALQRAVRGHGSGIYNIPGADTLPLSVLIARRGRRGVPVPGPLLSPLYLLRRWSVGFAFRYDQNRHRFHLGGVLDGTRALSDLGYRPEHPCASLVSAEVVAEPSARSVNHPTEMGREPALREAGHVDQQV